MTKSSTEYAEINRRLMEIQFKYEQSKGISLEDLQWVLHKVEQGLELASAGQNLAEAAKMYIDLQNVEIARLTKELAAHEA